MIPISVSTVCQALNIPCPPTLAGLMVQRVVTDSRVVRPGDLFVALAGSRHDGHEFLIPALEGGAVACLCSADRVPHGSSGVHPSMLPVPDALAGLGQLAGYYRRNVIQPHTVVIAVTGSNGKTTTKFMMEHVLKSMFRGRSSPRSFNNAIGVPLTLLSTEADDRFVVVEIGTNGPGEVSHLASMTAPGVGVVTSIGEAHLAGLDGIRAIAAEKASLFDWIQANGLIVANVDRTELVPLLTCPASVRLVTFGFDGRARLGVRVLRSDVEGTTLELDGRFPIHLSFPGIHHATNAAAAFAVARWFGVPPATISERLASFVPPDGRTRVHRANGLTIVDDSYNANPASMAAAVQSVQRATGRRRVFVLGDMLELGSSTTAAHARVVGQLLEAGVELVIGVGPATRAAIEEQWWARGATDRLKAFHDAVEVCEAVHRMVRPGDVVWVKGSRAMGLERVVTALQGIEDCRAAVA